MPGGTQVSQALLEGSSSHAALEAAMHEGLDPNKWSQPYATSKTGMKGVTVVRRDGKDHFRCRIMLSGERKSLGFFETPEAAGLAYARAEKEHHKEREDQNGTENEENEVYYEELEPSVDDQEDRTEEQNLELEIQKLERQLIQKKRDMQRLQQERSESKALEQVSYKSFRSNISVSGDKTGF
jgi:hypothetical protein